MSAREATVFGSSSNEAVVKEFDGTEPSRLKLSPKGTQDVSVIDMDTLAEEISNVADDFDRFIDELYDARLIRRKPGISLESLPHDAA